MGKDSEVSASSSTDETTPGLRGHSRSSLTPIRLPSTIPAVWPEIIKRDELCNTIVRTADEALQSGDLTEAAREALPSVLAQFVEAFEEVASDANVLFQPITLHAIETAYLIGLLIGTVPGEIEKALKAQSTRPARDARSAKPIQGVIDEAARAYWKDHPKKRDKLSDTARTIAPTVRIFVKQNREGLSENVRKKWGSICSDDKRLLDAIRKRLPNVAKSG